MPQRKPPRLAIHVQLEAPDTVPPTRRWLASQLRRLATRANVRAGVLNILIVGDAKMSDLHLRYNSVAGTTDVLTFDLRDDASNDDAVEGDIVLCEDEAARQAAKRAHPVRMELLLYALHGMLHLLGYDDHSPAEHRRMHAMEDELLQGVGLRSVYAKPRPPQPKRLKDRRRL